MLDFRVNHTVSYDAYETAACHYSAIYSKPINLSSQWSPHSFSCPYQFARRFMNLVSEFNWYETDSRYKWASFTDIPIAHLFLSEGGITCYVGLGISWLLHYREGLYDKNSYFIILNCDYSCIATYTIAALGHNLIYNFLFFFAFFLGILWFHYKVIRASPV